MHEILENAFLHVDELPDDLDLVAEVKALNDQGVEIPWLWAIATGSTAPRSPDQKALGFGINNTIGALDWAEGDTRLVPRDGTNTEWTVYHLAGMHDAPIPPHAEVPADTVYAVLAEFLRTRSRPTCIEWTDSADITSLRSASESDAP
ncbi:Imm1 family immunity protein [Actinokineospora sp. 24-640]